MISICIPTYEMGGKGLKFLRQGIESIRLQTFDNYEIIISDNSKVDDIENYCNEVKKDIVYDENGLPEELGHFTELAEPADIST